jgi:hypothetical protein
MDWLASLDLALKILLGVGSLCGVIFMAGSAWAGLSKALGSQAALHRRLDEQDAKWQLRAEKQDATLVEIRIQLARLQTWKSTQRFKLPESEAPMFKDDE